MRYDPNETPSMPAPAPTPAKSRRAPKPVLTPAMKAFAGISDAMVQIMTPCSQQDVQGVRKDFMAHLDQSQATDWRSAWQLWRANNNGLQDASSKLQVAPAKPATCHLPPEPTPLTSSLPPSPSSFRPEHPWVARQRLRRHQMPLSVREPGTLAIA